MKILVAEDDRFLCRAIAEALGAEGFDVDATQDGAEALFLAEQGVYDLLVLDIVMPGMTGLSIVSALRDGGADVPVLFVTARDAVSDRVTGLNIGADDYLVKPFALPELLARVHALLRRSTGARPERTIACGGLELNVVAHEACFEGAALGLTAKEYELLEYLVINRGSILTRGQLCDRLWGYDSDIGFGILDVHIHNLRKKMAEQGCDRFVQTIRGVGYLFRADENGGDA